MDGSNRDQKAEHMAGEYADREPGGTSLPAFSTQQLQQQEDVLAAIALLLGPDTDHQRRIRAGRQLARRGPQLLPFLLQTLDTYPEITTPGWPWWPPQYEQISRLLIQLTQSAQLSLEACLRYPGVRQPPGPVLWVGIIEAANLLPHDGHETLLREGLQAPWNTVRYASAMALANLASRSTLQENTLFALHTCQQTDPDVSVLLASSCALLRSGDNRSIEVLMNLLYPHIDEEVRKAAVFVLATELPIPLAQEQRERLAETLVQTLSDPNHEIALHAAHALRSVALPASLPALAALLDSPYEQFQLIGLIALEEVASRKAMRQLTQRHALPTHIVPLLRSMEPEIRRQASYTLAAIGGEYAAAVLGTTLLDSNHPGHTEAIEALRLLADALHAPTRVQVVRWLLRTVRQPGEEVQVTALDSLSYLVWRARSQSKRQAFLVMSQEIVEDGIAGELLSSPSAWVRQRAVELLGMLDDQLLTWREQLEALLYNDSDSGVRACVAYAMGQNGIRQAIPALIDALLDRDEYVALTALNALGALATPDDSVVLFVVRELAGYSILSREEGDRLSEAAAGWLKKWKKAWKTEK